MRTYSELGHVHRTEPCLEYPGEWLVFIDGGAAGEFTRDTFEAAFELATERNESASVGTEVSICWNCSDNDPRLGEVWFTGFYQHGKFDRFGRYRS